MPNKHRLQDGHKNLPKNAEKIISPLRVSGMVIVALVALGQPGRAYLVASQTPHQTDVTFVEELSFVPLIASILGVSNVLVEVRDTTPMAVRLEIKEAVRKILAEPIYLRKFMLRVLLNPAADRDTRERIYEEMMTDFELRQRVNLKAYQISGQRYLESLFRLQEDEDSERTRPSILTGWAFKRNFKRVVRSTIQLSDGTVPTDLFSLREIEDIVYNFIVRGGKMLTDLLPQVDSDAIFAGPIENYCLDAAAARLVDTTVAEMLNFLRERFPDGFNEEAVRKALVKWLSRRMSELTSME